MRKIIIVFSLLSSFGAFAQEVLGPLSFNPRLYYSTARGQHPHQNNRYKNFVMVEDSNVIVQSDTLSLPFIDDFSYPTLKPYNYTGYITDSVHNAIGRCDTLWPVSTVTDTFSLYPTYTYSFNTTTQTIDSIPKAPIVFLNSPITGECFYNLGNTAFLYPLDSIGFFDSATGQLIYQIPDTNDVTVGITYAPVLYMSTAPTYTKWLDNNAYQNNTFGYLPPSIGVVTFDGTNSQGQPYEPTIGGNPAAWGMADVLTSKPLFMGSYTDADSVYLSFFYEPGGFGYAPTPLDSFVLQFYNGYTSHWDDIWSVTGDSTQPSFPGDSIQLDTPNWFRQVILRIPSTNISSNIEYLYDGFQFRFLNYGSLTGINTIWNLDYVRLAKNRTVTDTSISDLAFQYTFPSILKNYYEMPAEQFTGNADLADTIQLLVANLDPYQAIHNPPATTWTTAAAETYPASSVVLVPTSNTFNAGLENPILLFPGTQYTSPAIGTNDSVIINTQAILDETDALLTNDTIRRTQVLDNVLAYDDGSAELAYGVQNLTSPTNKFAYDYTLNRPDSLYGFQVLFTTVGIDVHDLAFDFNLWYTLDTQNVFYTDSAVWTSNVYVPYYIDSVNGFTTYTVDPPFPLPTHFYFGWAQTDIRNLQIGYDMNSTKGRPHMYIYANGVWQKSTLPTDGSPMLRLLVGHSYQIGSGIKNTAVNPVKVYPNPTSGMLTFDLPDAATSYNLQLYNMMGQMSLDRTLNTGNNTINIGNLNEGLYLIKLTDNSKGISYQNKIVKTGKN
jgi:hypothetical protein